MLYPDRAATGSATNDPRYEAKAIGILALGFGVVGLDRFIINPLFPLMQKDLGLNYQDLGLISAVLALAWGIASIIGGRMADRWGQKRVLVPAVLVFSLLVATSGFATGMVSLLVIRAVMGLAEGAYVPASIAATINASKQTRLGLNVGIQQMASPLVGLGFGPLIAVGLLSVLPSWHWVFAAVAIPGLFVAFLIAKVIRPDVPVPQSSVPAQDSSAFRQLIGMRAVWVNTAIMTCSLSCLITISAFMPSYLTDHLKLDIARMGLVLAGQGLGSCAGMVLIPALSDRIGRKPVVVCALFLELAVLALLPGIGAHGGALFANLFAITLLNSGVVALAVGPLTSESVPRSMISSATGIVVGVGEILGGAAAPAMAGVLAHRIGITTIPTVALCAIGVALCVALLGIPRQTPISSILN